MGDDRKTRRLLTIMSLFTKTRVWLPSINQQQHKHAQTEMKFLCHLVSDQHYTMQKIWNTLSDLYG